MRWNEAKPELKPCAHCKGTARFSFAPVSKGVSVFVRCERCGVMTKPRLHTEDYESEMMVAKDWNRRP